MSNECRCTNPDGGRHKCPPQHIAICIRDNGGECNGECSPIPGNFQFENNDFGKWLQDNIYEVVNEFAKSKYPSSLQASKLLQMSDLPASRGGSKTYTFGKIRLDVRYSFEFSKDEESGRHYAY